MPRPTLPPTPAPSGDLLGREGQQLPSLEQPFALPPPAIVSKPESGAREARSKGSAQALETPMSPLSPVAGPSTSRRRLSAARSAGGKDDFTLPPPPTRSRKIIQMKPRSQKAAAASASAAKTSSATTTAPSTAAATGTSKGKQPSATSAAGRKVARKTAHSLIERRRRSKMNEEFGVLKEMIPACRDQEMHKLAILQASIEYLRYLERCIVDLEANARGSPITSARSHGSPVPEDGHVTDEQDQVMEDPPPSAPASVPDEPTPPDPTISQLCSPALAAHVTYSPTAGSWTTSPALAPIGQADPSPATSMSPAVPPGWPGGRDVDQEATEALLLLNSDRRRSMTRGMSVKDLLTS